MKVLLPILGLYGVPMPIIAAIRLLYDSSFFRVQAIYGLTAFLKTLVGVLQDNTFSSYLFIIVLD